MFESLRELMKEDLDEALEKGTEIGKENAELGIKKHVRST